MSKREQNFETFTKESLVAKLKEIESLGWILNDSRTTNDGAAGNKLEDLLHIPENNLPIPNASEWELKTHRDHTTALLTLFHMEPSPRALRIVPNYLLTHFGWKHQQAGTRYPSTEKSFRATLSSGSYTRGFTISVDEAGRKVCVVFNPQEVRDKDNAWLDQVSRNLCGDDVLVPYWGFDDLFSHARTKLLNCFCVDYEVKREQGRSYFHYYRAWRLEELRIDLFIGAISRGTIFIDFDSRTGHNHGTKFRIKAR